MCENNKKLRGDVSVLLQILVPFSDSQTPSETHTRTWTCLSAQLDMWCKTQLSSFWGKKARRVTLHARECETGGGRLAACLWGRWLSAEIYLCLFQFQFICILKKAKNIQGVLVTLPSNLCGSAITCHGKLNLKAETSGSNFSWRGARLSQAFCLATVLLGRNLISG